MKYHRSTLLAVAILLMPGGTIGAEPAPTELFRRDNLVAWCIVPFDAARRSPDERARMLVDLGIRQLAYDWRDEHVPQFDEEITATKRHGVRIVAWWMAGAELNEANRQILDTIRRHDLKLQLWVSMGDPDATLEQAEKVERSADIIRPLATEAAKLGCQVGLYNHGGWFGEPENQLAILQALALDNVGIVYNQHHGHAHVGRFAELLAKIKPHLLALNLNGMAFRGDETEKKILPIGAGELDLALLRIVADSGYRGPIGILNHTDLDARARLADNLAGLEWLVERLAGDDSVPPPRMETYQVEHAALDRENKTVPQADAAVVADLIVQAREHGDATRGAALFASHKFACVNCHRVSGAGGTIGPELTRIGRDRCAEEIVEALLWPARKVHPEYQAWSIATDEGNVLHGYLVGSDEAQLKLREATSGEVVCLPHRTIVEKQAIGSLMPEGLAAAMTLDERRDVVRFLLELGSDSSQAHAVMANLTRAEFPYDFAPLEPAPWRYVQHPVNRDRLYDFYSKEADYFRDHASAAHLLPAYPGLDGGRYGHWGNQDEETWRDDRWNQMDDGPVVCGIVSVEGRVLPRAICVRLGGDEQMAACFDTQTLSYVAVWQGGFVQRSAVRHGFVEGLTPAGSPLKFVAGAPPRGEIRYHGYYRHGSQVLFSYSIEGQKYLDAPTIDAGEFKRVIAAEHEHPLRHMTHGGPQQYPQILETQGQLGSGGAYAIDTILPPRDNPWNALFFFGGHDFLPDGSALLCTMQGDVWHVSGLDESLAQVRWKRFATGLHHPQGLVVADGQIYVLGRNQITRLHDLNGDDEADFYECFSRAFVTSPAGHDFICGLERDAAGNFYTASGNQGLLRISPDGQRAEVLATGFRNPDGLGLLPDGSITVPCSEGEWTPTSMICLVRQPGSAIPPHYGYRGLQDGQPPELPLVYLPRGLDNSSGGQSYVASNRWGPTTGQLVHLSYGAGTYFLVLRDEVRGQPQGGVVPMPGDFAAGPHRGRFHPLDGQLYVTGMGGWGTYTAEDGALERVRYTGQPVQLPTSFHVHENGVLLTFALPVDRAIAGVPGRQFAQAWNYRYSSAYGSAEYVPSHDGTVGHERVPITGAYVLDDERSMFLAMPDLQPVNQLHLRLTVDGGRPLDLFLTVHALDVPFTRYAGYVPRTTAVAAHPMLADVARLNHPPDPNPWRERLAGARAVEVEAGKNLTFATRSIAVRPEEPLELKFTNPDVVPHNWVLIRPGALNRVGDLVNRLVADPSAARRHYVPQSDDVLAYTDIVGPGEKVSIFFRAPKEPGRYPYLCSFPGHWMVMNGVLIVE